MRKHDWFCNESCRSDNNCFKNRKTKVAQTESNGGSAENNRPEVIPFVSNIIEICWKLFDSRIIIYFDFHRFVELQQIFERSQQETHNVMEGHERGIKNVSDNIQRVKPL